MKPIKYSYDRKRALKLIEGFVSEGHHALKSYSDTKEFIDRVFDEYEGKVKHQKVDFAFAIPTRASRHDPSYWEEVYDFLPALRYLDHETAFRILASLPPFIIGEYGKETAKSTGVILFVPIFSDMLKDYKNKLFLKQIVKKRINDAINFARKRLGVEYVGLGANLPKLTKFGKTIKADVNVTTGHAGTVWLLVDTFCKIINERKLDEENLKVGVAGFAGSISSAALQFIASNHPAIEFYGFDTRQKMMIKKQAQLKKQGIHIELAKNNHDLISKCNIIISAVTSKIDLNGCNIKGKYFLDDSQPGSFNKAQVEKGGGELFWVIGHDYSKEKFASRKNDYTYGKHGLAHANDLWGCEAEVASAAYYQRPDLMVRDHVTMKQVAAIGELFEQAGIASADFQSYGQINS